MLTLICAGTAIVAWVMHRSNSARVNAYHADPACSTELTPSDERAASAPIRSCAIERATVRARWIHTYKSSRYYRVAFALPDGSMDSLELKTKRAAGAWAVMPVGTSVTVERFTDPDPNTKRHVTAVRAAGRPVPSAWNPLLRDRDTSVGTVAMGLLAIGFGVGWNWSVGRRRLTRAL